MMAAFSVAFCVTGVVLIFLSQPEPVRLDPRTDTQAQASVADPNSPASTVERHSPAATSTPPSTDDSPKPALPAADTAAEEGLSEQGNMLIDHLPIPGLTAIQPRMSAPRLTGRLPFIVTVSADLTTWTRDSDTDGLTPFTHLEYSWHFGDPNGTEEIVDPFTEGTVNARMVNANDCQTGAIATYCYRTAGTYTITLRARGWTGTEWIEATTTTVQVVPMWLMRKDMVASPPTAGTLTVTVTIGEDEHTTDSLPYNVTGAALQAAIEALPHVGAGNVEVIGWAADFADGVFGWDVGSPALRFIGDLIGTEVDDVSVTTTGFNRGGIYPVRVQTMASASVVTATTPSFNSTVYIDTNAAPGGDGSENAPYSTTADWSAIFTTAGDRTNIRVMLARGSVITSGAALFGNDYSGLRIEAYGTGDPPVIKGNSAALYFQNRYGAKYHDIVISNVQLSTNDDPGTGHCVTGIVSTNGGGTYREHAEHIYFDRCIIKQGDVPPGSEPSGISWGMFDTLGFGVWRCTFIEERLGQVIGYLPEYLSDGVCVGNVFQGGGNDGTPRNYSYYHHIYDSGRDRCLISWNRFLESSHDATRTQGRNFALNMNAYSALSNAAENFPRRYCVIANNLIRGTTNGLNFDGSQNDVDGPHFDQVVIEDNVISDLGSVSTASTSGIWAAGGLDRVVVRRNDWRGWGWSKKAQKSVGGYAIGTGNHPDLQAWIYGNTLHTKADGAYGFQVGGGSGMIVGNRVLLSGANTLGVLISTTSTGTWEVDYNEYNLAGIASPTRKPFRDDEQVYHTIATWQAAGYDTHSTFRDTAKRLQMNRIEYEIVPEE